MLFPSRSPTEISVLTTVNRQEDYNSVENYVTVEFQQVLGEVNYEFNI